jgi:hypothetical protein
MRGNVVNVVLLSAINHGYFIIIRKLIYTHYDCGYVVDKYLHIL